MVSLRCRQLLAVDDEGFVYGNQLSNPRSILSERTNHSREYVKSLWQNIIFKAQWFEPILHLQFTIKTIRVAKFIVLGLVKIDSYNQKVVKNVVCVLIK